MAERLLRETPAAGPAAPGNGFTLIEVVMSLVITMTAFLAILAMMNTSFRSYGRGKRLTVATNLAYEKLQDFKTLEVTSIVSGSDTVAAANTDFTRTWTVSDLDLDADGVADMQGDIVKIDLVITWSHGGTNYNVAMATMSTGRPE